jgi:hypothetical protein
MSHLFRIARKFINVRREQQLREMWTKCVRVRHRSAAENVYHCCVWKTASQWIRNVLSSTAVYRYSGLLPYAYEQHEGRDDRTLQERTFDHPFPPRHIVSPLYINHESFVAMPKPNEYRAFFVVRDPRDLVVSHFFSSKYSHVDNPGVREERARLDNLTDQEGMLIHMRYMAERGIFDALRSWGEGAKDDQRVKIFRFEDLVSDNQFHWMSQLMEHCDIPIPESDLRAILDRLSFARLSGGRKQGDEDKHHKYRSGKAGDWKKYFDQPLRSDFKTLTGDLVELLGYEQS